MYENKQSKPQLKLTDCFDAPLERIAELVITSLNTLGYRIKAVNDKLRTITAYEEKTDRRDSGRLVFRYEFDVELTWRKAPDGAEVSVSIAESSGSGTYEQCRLRCEDILDSIDKHALLLRKLEDEDTSNQYGAARWAKPQDIKNAGYIVDKPHSRRLVLGPGPNGTIIASPDSDTDMHCLLRGPTGSGKTSRFIIPQEVMRLDTSAIVTEATAGDEPPDVYTKTAGWKAAHGHKIYYFNPDDLSSVRFNPVELASTVNNAQDMADLIVENTSLEKQYGGDPIWPTSERHLLTAMLIWAYGEKTDLSHVRKVLRLGANGIGMMLMNSVYSEARDEYMAFFRVSSEGFRNGVISGLMSRLNLWVNPRIAALTSTTDFDVKALPNEKFTFYLAVPAHKERLKPLAVLMFNFLLKLTLDKEFKFGIHLTLDELMQFNRIPRFAEALTIIRHRHIPVMIGIQSNKQPIKVYGRDEASILMDMLGTTISLRPRDFQTARDISQALGTKTVVDRKATSSGQINEREFGRPLMEPSEILTLDTTKAIVQTPSTPPILLDCYKWQDFEYATKIPPPARRILEVSEELTRACNKEKAKADWQKQWETKEKPEKAIEENSSRSDAERPRVEQPTKDVSDEDEESGERDDLGDPPF